MPALRRGHTVKPIPKCRSVQKLTAVRDIKVFTTEQFQNFNRGSA